MNFNLEAKPIFHKIFCLIELIAQKNKMKGTNTTDQELIQKIH